MFSGCLLPAICLIGTGYVSENEAIAVFLITAAVGTLGISNVCWNVNPVDLCPHHAGESRCSIIIIIVVVIVIILFFKEKADKRNF